MTKQSKLADRIEELEKEVIRLTADKKQLSQLRGLRSARLQELTNEVDFQKGRVSQLEKDRRIILDAITVFQNIVPLKDVRDRILVELLALQPQLLARHAQDSKINKIPEDILKQIPVDIQPDILAYFQQEKKIQAIKAVRNRTGLGLKESKDIIDNLWGYLTPLA